MNDERMTLSPEMLGTDWINAGKFGFVGDGVTLNDDVMETYISNYADIPLYFGKGVYCFARSIDFPDYLYLHLDPKAELRCVAKEPLDYFITLQRGVNDWRNFEDYAHQSGIHGGTINANYCAKTALGLHGGLHTHFSDFMIKNVLEKGIVTEINERHDGAYTFDRIYFYNERGLAGTVAMYDNSADNSYTKCTAVNFETGIRTSGGKFTSVSCWFNKFGVHLIPTSVYARVISGNQSVFINPLVDTYRTGFRLEPSAEGKYPSVSITDMVWITNNIFYTCGRPDPEDNLQRDYPMLAFDVASDKSKIMVNGLYLPWREWGFAFSNIPLPSSSFLNVRYEAGWDPWNHMKNFRDDISRMRAGKAIDDWSDMPKHSEWHPAWRANN